MQSPVQRFNPQFTYKSVKDYASQLAMDLVKNGNGLSQNAMIGITSFVKLDTSLQNTTVLGNQLAEYSISEIQQFGLHVIDFKLMPAMQVKSNGDLTFSRNLLQLANNNVMNHVMSGTMIEKAEGVFVNARIISLSNNRVVSSASVLIPRFVAEQTKPRFVSYGAE
jgi:TolB-like protein